MANWHSRPGGAFLSARALAHVHIRLQAYIDTDLFQKDVIMHPAVPRLLASFVHTLNSYAERRFSTGHASPVTPLDDQLVFGCMVPMLHRLLTKHYRQQCADAVHLQIIEVVIALKMMLEKACSLLCMHSSFCTHCL